MENDPSLDDVLVLRVKNICCAAYQKKLKKELSKIDGVHSFTIDPEKSLVSVRGRVNANALLQTITETGKAAEIIHYPTTYTSTESDYHFADRSRQSQEGPRNSNYQQHKNRGPEESRYQQDTHHQIPRRENCQHPKNDCYGSDESRYQQDTNQIPRRENCQHPKNDCYLSDESRFNRHRDENYRQQRSCSFEEDHICESYVRPMGQRLCREYDHRMQHDRRPIFPGNVPLGYVPYHAGLHNRPSYWPSVYGYGLRPVRGFGNYGVFGHGIGRGYRWMV